MPKNTNCRVTEKGFIVGIRIKIRNPEPSNDGPL